MPCICLIVGALFIKACAHWYQLQDTDYGKYFQTKSSFQLFIIFILQKRMGN